MALQKVPGIMPTEIMIYSRHRWSRLTQRWSR